MIIYYLILSYIISYIVRPLLFDPYRSHNLCCSRCMRQAHNKWPGETCCRTCVQSDGSTHGQGLQIELIEYGAARAADRKYV